MSEPFRRVRGFSGVMYVPDGRLIWPDPRSLGWLQYQDWLSEGNTPDPAEEEEEG